MTTAYDTTARGAARGRASTDRQAERGRMPFPGSPVLDGLSASDGTSFASVRRSLQPRYERAWVDLAARWALLAGGYAAMCFAAARLGAHALYLVPPAALWIGFWFASIVLFMHEAAHFQLHPDKTANDRLANLAICWLIGDEVGHYRVLHWQHHLHLGDPHDSEVSYHHAPSLRFGLETLVGLHALRVFVNHRRARPEGEDRKRSDRRDVTALGRGLVAHGALLAVTLYAGLWPAALSWLLAVAVVFPYFSALRQQLEHRSHGAASGIDYARIPHGAVNRMFRPTLFARAMGAAGFRQHLLHHWDPSVSYTRFDDLEAFLMRTELAPLIEDTRTTYGAAWRSLARS